MEAKLEGLRLLGLRLKEISDYLADVCEEKLPLNPNVLYTIQVRRQLCSTCPWAGMHARTHAALSLKARVPAEKNSEA